MEVTIFKMSVIRRYPPTDVALFSISLLLRAPPFSLLLGTLSGISESKWIKANYKSTGFFRVTYSDANWKLLVDQLNANHSVNKFYVKDYRHVTDFICVNIFVTATFTVTFTVHLSLHLQLLIQLRLC